MFAGDQQKQIKILCVNIQFNPGHQRIPKIKIQKTWSLKYTKKKQNQNQKTYAHKMRKSKTMSKNLQKQ